MENTFVLDPQISSCVLLPSEMVSILGQKYFLCNIKEIDGNCLVDSQESSLILCKVLNVPYLMNDLKKLKNIKYCHPCMKRILKIQESLDSLKKLEKEVLDEKYLIELQLETNYKVIGNELHYSPCDFGVELVNEMKFKSIKSKLKKVVQNQIVRKFCWKAKNYRIMKNITITEKLKHGTFEKHIISKESTPLIYNIISADKKPLIKDNLFLPSNGYFEDSATNSPFNRIELPIMTSHVYNFDNIKLDLLSGETNNTVDIKDPFEGIVPESNFQTENSTTQKSFICGTCETSFDDYSELDEHYRTHIGPKSLTFCPNESEVSLNTNSNIHVNNCDCSECRHCVKIFQDRVGLKQHERHHSKSFKCSYCETSFFRSYTLKMHERIHTKEKPFKCANCDKTFRTSTHLKSHGRTHEAVKPLKCKYCEKTYRDHSCMKSHERIHTGDTIQVWLTSEDQWSIQSSAFRA